MQSYFFFLLSIAEGFAQRLQLLDELLLGLCGIFHKALPNKAASFLA
jgi:hypothetical protein